MAITLSTPHTSWERGRLDSRRGPQSLLFGHMFEDSAIERKAFESAGRVFCIASAGCTAMVLAELHEVVAIDINPVQLDYMKQRLKSGHTRLGVADRVIEYLRFFGPLVGWSYSRLRTFLDLENTTEQMRVWRRHLDTRRFRLGLGLLFSHALLRFVYAHELRECLPPNFGMVLRNRFERCFARHPNRMNRYAHALLLGERWWVPVMPQFRDIQLIHADAAEFLERQPPGRFDGFALSNITDGANRAYRQRLFSAVKRAAAPGATVVMRSLREPREGTVKNHAPEDRSMIWGVVDVRKVGEL